MRGIGGSTMSGFASCGYWVFIAGMAIAQTAGNSQPLIPNKTAQASSQPTAQAGADVNFRLEAEVIPNKPEIGLFDGLSGKVRLTNIGKTKQVFNEGRLPTVQVLTESGVSATRRPAK